VASLADKVVSVAWLGDKATALTNALKSVLQRDTSGSIYFVNGKILKEETNNKKALQDARGLKGLLGCS